MGLRPADRELIEAAALLANVGYLINFEGHHKHSYHLILNSELPAFEREQLRLLALAARYHRGSRPKKKHDEYKALSDEDKRRVSALAAILRLALALDRTHQQHVETVKANVSDHSVEIAVRAHGDADVDLWAARGKVELFEKVFDREVLFTVNDVAGRRSSGKGRARGSAADRAPNREVNWRSRRRRPGDERSLGFWKRPHPSAVSIRRRNVAERGARIGRVLSSAFRLIKKIWSSPNIRTSCCVLTRRRAIGIGF